MCKHGFLKHGGVNYIGKQRTNIILLTVKDLSLIDLVHLIKMVELDMHICLTASMGLEKKRLRYTFAKLLLCKNPEIIVRVKTVVLVDAFRMEIIQM